MMEFIMLTVSITVAIMLSSFLSMGVIIKLMSSKKVAKLFTEYYLKYVNSIIEALEDDVI